MTRRVLLSACGLVLLVASGLQAQTASIREERRLLDTYPFSEPNPVPVLARDARLYPYHSFEGYAHEREAQEWTVVTLENDFIEVFVLPEVGGKVWGAVVKETGHEFIYRNEVMKFRNIALRGPWTSGGIEFNFGVIGHTPATATPVDYILKENADGSVSCIVGAMDLPSRTHWRVEIRLAPDKAAFETNVRWYNPTPLEQPYYNWMTAAAFAQPDLLMSIPGNAYLEHPGQRRDWPVDSANRYLPRYLNNTFGGHKSFHVVGELNDFFGGYYLDDDYGFGHWARHEEMPGQKLWLWALSREGGVWEELLTDTDGQYVEYQAGRLLVQYSPGDHRNPITQAGFEPGASDHWSETWFPLEGTGGLTDASADGAMFVDVEDGTVWVRVNAFRQMTDTLEISFDGETTATVPVTLEPLQTWEFTAPVAGENLRVRLPRLALDYERNPEGRLLDRPFDTDQAVLSQIPVADQMAFEARELSKGRRYREARDLYQRTLAVEPWHRTALLGMAELSYRRARYTDGLEFARRALQLDAYDAHANFVAGNLHFALGNMADAQDAYGWSSRSMAFRAASYVQLSELALVTADTAEAERYASLALDYDRYNLAARQLLAMIARHGGHHGVAGSLHAEMLAIDPLHHFVTAERMLAGMPAGDQAVPVARSEYPDQTYLELALDYARRGAADDAARLLGLVGEPAAPIAQAWTAWLARDASRIPKAANVAFVFPYRPETVPVLEWVVEHNNDWTWAYLLALNYWAVDRAEDAAEVLSHLGDAPDYGPMYAARAGLSVATRGEDLQRAVELAPNERVLWTYLVRHHQQAGRWEDALSVSMEARDRFPGDFNLDLLHVRSLNELNRHDDALVIMDNVRVLPSENGRESHALFAQSHLLAALAALDGGNAARALRHAETAMTWPERLGQGRPYNPDERLPHFIRARALEQLGRTEDARSAYRAILEYGPAQLGVSSLDLLNLASARVHGTPVTISDGGAAAGLLRHAAAAWDAPAERARVLAPLGEARVHDRMIRQALLGELR